MHPIDGVEVDDATTDRAVIEGWWGAMPDANIAIATGRASGLAAVRYDVDLLGVAGRAAIDPLLASDPWVLHLPSTTAADAVVSARGDSPVPSEVIRPGLAIVGDGDFVLAPGSQLLAGRVDAEYDPPPELPPPPWPLAGLRGLVASAPSGPERGAVLPARSSPLLVRHEVRDSIEPIVRTAADIIPVPVPWLWKGFIGQRALTSIDGDPGCGKSTLLIDLAARVTRGDFAPLSDEKMGRGSVLLIAGEDDVESVLRPRLDFARADVEHVFVMTDILVPGNGPRRVALPEHVDAIERVCVERGVRLVVIDPIMDFVGAGVDATSDHAVRQALASLRDLAQRRDLSVVLVRHLVKRRAGAAMHHGSGSIAFAGLARTVLQVNALADGGGVLSVVKSNAGRRPAPVAFDIIEATTPIGIDAGRVEWRAAPVVDEALRPDSVGRRARDLLVACLASGPMPANDVKALAANLNVGARSLETAKKDLGVVSQKVKSRWFWGLPGEGRNTAAPGEGRGLAALGDEDEGADEEDDGGEDSDEGDV